MKKIKKQMIRNLLNSACTFLLVFTSLCLISACQNNIKTKEKKNPLVNAIIDDSVLNIYIPKSILDSSLSKDNDFGFHEYYYGNKQMGNNSIQVRYELELEGGKPKGANHEVTTRVLVEADHLKRLQDKNVISIDSIVRSDLRIGIVNYSLGNGDTARYTTLAFVPSHKRQWYEIYINHDNSEMGRSLKDSIQQIIESISINNSEKR
jgi:hypothetical protein